MGYKYSEEIEGENRQANKEDWDHNFLESYEREEAALAAAGNAISQVAVVATQPAMLALDAKVGWVAKRTDNKGVYKLSALPATTLENWVYLGQYDITGIINPITDAVNDLASNKQDVSAKDVADGYMGLDGDAEANPAQLVKILADASTASSTRTWSIDKIKERIAASGGLNVVPVILFIGESNSGGYAENTDATGPELAARPMVQILNPLDLVFEDLKIGTPDSNNLLDHTGLTAGVTHGWELELANQVANDEWPVDLVYLVKAGQGGSMAADWNTPGTYFTKFKERVDAAKAYFATERVTPEWYIWFSLGINDAIDTTDLVLFKSQVKDFWKRIRNEVGFAPIILTELPSAYSAYTGVLQELINEDEFAYRVETGDASLRDANHWDYDGMKLIATRMSEYSLVIVGYGLPYILSQNLALSKRVAPSEGGGGGGLSTTWTLLENASVGTGNKLEHSSGDPCGAQVLETIDATAAFEYIIKTTSFSLSGGVVVFTEDDATEDNVWATSTDPFISGVFINTDENLYRTVQRGAATLVQALTQGDVWIKVRKSGDNVIYDLSYDAGASYDDNVFTHTGVLAGKTTIYLKALFAITGVAKEIVVERTV